MSHLVPIGRFSRMTHLTVKALRLYDSRGVLRPALVDFASGYRYYSVDQVRLGRLIRLLRSLDMPLDEIRAVLATDDPEAIHASLMSHRRRIEERIMRYSDALKALEKLDDRRYQALQGGAMTRDTSTYVCSFCGKPNAEVRHMIAGPKRVCICDECVRLCNEILAKEEAKA